MTRRIAEVFHLDALPPSIRDTLDSWRFAFTILVIAVAGLGIWAFVNTQQIANTQAEHTRDEAVKAAQIQASAQAAYTQCLASRPELEKLNSFLLGVNQSASALTDITSILITNSGAVVAATATDDPQYPVRVANLGRLVKADRKAETARRKISAIRNLPIPSLADCAKRRKDVLKGK